MYGLYTCENVDIYGQLLSYNQNSGDPDPSMLLSNTQLIIGGGGPSNILLYMPALWVGG